MHKLGELRWLYVEALPSTVWPLMKDFWSTSKYGLFFDDPNTGIIYIVADAALSATDIQTRIRGLGTTVGPNNIDVTGTTAAAVTGITLT